MRVAWWESSLIELEASYALQEAGISFLSPFFAIRCVEMRNALPLFGKLLILVVDISGTRENFSIYDTELYDICIRYRNLKRIAIFENLCINRSVTYIVFKSKIIEYNQFILLSL